MDLHALVFAFFHLGIFLLVKGSPNFIQPRKSPIVNAVLNLYCGVTEAPTNDDEPLRFSPWMVILTTISEKGKDSVVNCGATLVSGKHAITSDVCLRKEKSTPINAIIGAPNIQQLSQGYKRKINKRSILLSENSIVVLQFGHVIFNSDISPICLQRGDLSGLYATVGYNAEYKNQKKRKRIGKKIAYLRMQEYCKTNGFCAEVLPVEVFRHNVLLRGDPTQWERFFIEQERNIRLLFSLHERCRDFCESEESWEMEASEIQEGAPLLIKKEKYWYVKGILIEKNIDEDEDDKNGEDKDSNKKNADEKETKSEDKKQEKAKDKSNEDVKKDENDNDKGKDPENEKPEKNDSSAEKKNADDKDTKPEDKKPEEEKDKGNEDDKKDENGNDNGKDPETDEGNKDGDVADKNEDNNDGGPATPEEVVDPPAAKRRRKRAEPEGKGEEKYDLYFVKMTSDVVDELKELFSIFN